MTSAPNTPSKHCNRPSASRDSHACFSAQFVKTYFLIVLFSFRARSSAAASASRASAFDFKTSFGSPRVTVQYFVSSNAKPRPARRALRVWLYFWNCGRHAAFAASASANPSSSTMNWNTRARHASSYPFSMAYSVPSRSAGRKRRERATRREKRTRREGGRFRAFGQSRSASEGSIVRNACRHLAGIVRREREAEPERARGRCAGRRAPHAPKRRVSMSSPG